MEDAARTLAAPSTLWEKQACGCLGGWRLGKAQPAGALKPWQERPALSQMLVVLLPMPDQI